MSWFEDCDDILLDLIDCYGEDYTSIERIESLADSYINFRPLFECYAIHDFDEAIELLPNDLRHQYIKVQNLRGCRDIDVKLNKYDFFISHASEDKKDIAGPLAKELELLGAKVWFDKYELKIGDSLRESIDRGIAHSKYAVLILSQSYFTKFWTSKELNALFAKYSNASHKILLPVKHNISHAQILEYAPLIADVYSLDTSNDTTQKIAHKLISLLRD